MLQTAVVLSLVVYLFSWILRIYSQRLKTALAYVHLPAVQIAQLFLVACGILELLSPTQWSIISLRGFLTTIGEALDAIVQVVYTVASVAFLTGLALMCWEDARPTNTSSSPRSIAIVDLFQTMMKQSEACE